MTRSPKPRKPTRKASEILADLASECRFWRKHCPHHPAEAMRYVRELAQALKQTKERR